MPESRFLKIIIVALLLVNLGTLSYLWLGKNHPQHMQPRPEGPPHGPEGRGPAAFLRQELQLTDAQETAFRKMREQHHQTVMTIRDQMAESKRSLYLLMKTGNNQATSTEAGKWLDSLAAQQRRIEVITFDHFKDVRALCTPQQQERFDEVIGDALQQLH